MNPVNYSELDNYNIHDIHMAFIRKATKYLHCVTGKHSSTSIIIIFFGKIPCLIGTRNPYYIFTGGSRNQHYHIV